MRLLLLLGGLSLRLAPAFAQQPRQPAAPATRRAAPASAAKPPLKAGNKFADPVLRQIYTAQDERNTAALLP
ncbi:hypothetical protein, partial [uncultured Hymenobacter sp.]|uniref:hypothetical protein n=1 Tax=uncultured Hymenobacter sp. TaxID=170016 RepID=UPI0035CA243C